MRAVILFFLLIAAPAWAQLEVEKPWTRATPPGAKVAAGYMVIRNRSGSPDRLISASSPAAARVETHVQTKEGDIIRMREVKGYEVPAKGSLELKPGGAHLMLVDIKRAFKEGETVPATLRFRRAGEVKVGLRVEPLGAMGAGHAH